MKIEVIGMTTEPSTIANILGVKTQNDYGLYQKTDMGEYYGKFLPNGTIETKLVRLVSHEKAAEMEASTVVKIEKQEKNMQHIIANVPVVNTEKHRRACEAIGAQAKASAEEMGKRIKRSLENAGFHPSYNQ